LDYKKKKISKKITSKSALYETALSFREEGTFEQGGGEQE
jgi:hypothetical protein